jgi:hypothetical protein
LEIEWFVLIGIGAHDDDDDEEDKDEDDDDNGNDDGKESVEGGAGTEGDNKDNDVPIMPFLKLEILVCSYFLSKLLEIFFS